MQLLNCLLISIFMSMLLTPAFSLADSTATFHEMFGGEKEIEGFINHQGEIDSKNKFQELGQRAMDDELSGRSQNPTGMNLKEIHESGSHLDRAHAKKLIDDLNALESKAQAENMFDCKQVNNAKLQETLLTKKKSIKDTKVIESFLEKCEELYPTFTCRKRRTVYVDKKSVGSSFPELSGDGIFFLNSEWERANGHFVLGNGGGKCKQGHYIEGYLHFKVGDINKISKLIISYLNFSDYLLIELNGTVVYGSPLKYRWDRGVKEVESISKLEMRGWAYNSRQGKDYRGVYVGINAPGTNDPLIFPSNTDIITRVDGPQNINLKPYLRSGANVLTIKQAYGGWHNLSVSLLKEDYKIDPLPESRDTWGTTCVHNGPASGSYKQVDDTQKINLSSLQFKETPLVCIDRSPQVIEGVTMNRDCFEYKWDKIYTVPTTNICAGDLEKRLASEKSISDLEWEKKCVLQDEKNNCLKVDKIYSYNKLVDKKEEEIELSENDQRDVAQRAICNIYPEGLDDSTSEVPFIPQGEFLDTVTKFKAIKEGAKTGEGIEKGNIKVFTGTNKHCSIHMLSYRNCCNASGWGKDIFWKECGQQAQELAYQRPKNQCIYVGGAKSGGGHVKKQHYCCFNSAIDRLIQEEGRKQLGIGWSGSGDNCRGLTPEELGRIDFSKIDTSKISAELLKDLNLGSKIGEMVGDRLNIDQWQKRVTSDEEIDNVKKAFSGGNQYEDMSDQVEKMRSDYLRGHGDDGKKYKYTPPMNEKGK